MNSSYCGKQHALMVNHDAQLGQAHFQTCLGGSWKCGLRNHAWSLVPSSQAVPLLSAKVPCNPKQQASQSHDRHSQGREHCAVNAGSSPELSPEDNFNRLNCLSLDPEYKTRFPSALFQLDQTSKNTCMRSWLHLTDLTSSSLQNLLSAAQLRQSFPGQRFIFLKSVTFPRSAES